MVLEVLPLCGPAITKVILFTEAIDSLVIYKLFSASCMGLYYTGKAIENAVYCFYKTILIIILRSSNFLLVYWHNNP